MYMKGEPHIDALWEDHDMGTPKDSHEIQRDWMPAEETGLQTPEQKVPNERENPLNNPLINPIPGDNEPEPEDKKSPTLH
jgi:hypothetical protein